MAKVKETQEQEKQPLTTPDVKVDSVKEAAGRIARGEKVRHPGPWVKIEPRKPDWDIEQEVVQLQKEGRLIGYDPKTQKGYFKNI